MTIKPASDRLAPLVPLPVQPGVLRRWIAPGLSLLILVAALAELRTASLHEMARLLPRSPLFWIVFAAYYLTPSMCEWVIFRRLWSLPPGGLLALLRKTVSNEILIGYSGEVYFYGWARRHAKLVTAPFGAVKDVAVLSAAVANLVTLALVAVSWRLLRDLHLGTDARLLAGSALIVTILSLATMIFRRAIFSLPRRELTFVAAMHALRIAAVLLLTALLWAILVPGTPLSLWFVLATLRMLVSRLPLIPNKEIVFAGLAAFLLGAQAPVAAAISLLAGLVLAVHLLLGAGLAAGELIEVGQRP